MKFLQVISREVFKHYRSNPRYDFEYLENSPVLHSTDFLKEMLQYADSKEKEDCILGHMYKHGAFSDGYGDIEKKIIKKRL